MSKSQGLFLAVFVCVLSTALVFIGVAASKVAADPVAEAVAKPRISVVEEAGFASGAAGVSIVRIVHPRRYGDVTVEYCIVVTRNGSAVVLKSDITQE